MGLFSDMSKFGLGDYQDAKVFEEKKQENKNAQVAVEKKEEDFLFDKHYECPVCGNSFTVRTMMIGKIKAVGKDTDLKPIYEDIDPLKYDAITCDKCGYSSITRYFGKISAKQGKTIHEEIGKKFNGINNKLEKYSYDDAIIRHKLAVVTTIVKNAKSSEKAYTCFKLSWILRAKRNSLQNGDPQIKELYMDEIECTKNAYEGFLDAMEKEQFPIAGMDENTYRYILADLARRLRKFDEALRMIGNIITSTSANPRIKEEARKLKDIIKEDMQKIVNNTGGN